MLPLVLILLSFYEYQDAEVANMYLGNYEQFLSTARFWTESYAMTKEEIAALPEVRYVVIRYSLILKPTGHIPDMNPDTDLTIPLTLTDPN